MLSSVLWAELNLQQERRCVWIVARHTFFVYSMQSGLEVYVNGLSLIHIYTPLMDGAVWGADLPKSPVMLNPQFSGAPEPIDVFMVPAGRWSDGTAAPVM